MDAGTRDQGSGARGAVPGGRRLAWQLLRLGHASHKGAEAGRTRFGALLLASAVLALTFCSFVLASAAWDGREARGAARTPALAERGEQAKALWSRYWDSYGGRQFTVVVIAPLTDDAPLPPGVGHWPAPGEVLLSPALAEAPRAEDLAHRYGKVAGRIDGAGLASPGERLAYVRPTADLLRTADLERITGYGGHWIPFGDLRVVGERTAMWALLAVLLGLPALALVVAAARTGAAGRDRRDALLDALGAGRGARLCVDLGGAALPVALGTLLAGAALVPALLYDVRLPWIGYTLAAADARAGTAALSAAMGLAALTALGLVLLLRPAPTRRSGARSNRPTSAQAGPLRLLALGAFPVFVLLAMFSGPLLGGAQRSAVAYLFAVAGVWATLPWVLGWGAGRWSRKAAGSARHQGNPALLIAVRTMAARPAAVVRLVAVLVVAVGVLGQAQILSSLLSVMPGHERTPGTAAESAALVQSTHAGELPPAFRSSLPRTARVVALGQEGEGPETVRVMQAPCRDLALLDLPCPPRGKQRQVALGDLERRVRGAGPGPAGEPVLVRSGPVQPLTRGEGLRALVFAPGGSRLDLPAVKRAAHLHLSAKAAVQGLRESTEQPSELSHQSRWIPFLGALGAAVLLLAMAVAATAQFLRLARTLAPLNVLTGDRRVFHRTAVWAVGAPLCAAGTVGVGVHLVLVQPVTGGAYGGEVSWPLLAAMSAGTVLTALIATLVGGAVAAGRAASWVPRPD
ncbi:hypothetical protein GPA10_03440 [Streptomyces sp. p1417]|uniref:FtsX-like permease family protein n=1 Tax=Streptomyces typhae TaxID=2681492 RepID=A0A6L6WV74_9ACTN|nr:hypothetical protein [Streptomyces typhae]MVO83841.1 hypothetical protein [Streptomyces typhae]